MEMKTGGETHLLITVWAERWVGQAGRHTQARSEMIGILNVEREDQYFALAVSVAGRSEVMLGVSS